MNFYFDLADKRLEYLKEKFINFGYSVYNFSDNIKNIKVNSVIVLSPAYKLSEVEAKQLPNDVLLFTFSVANEVEKVLKTKNIKIINFMQDESFVLKNANLTAESFLCELLDNTQISLYDLNILILGGGRVAKALGEIFEKLNLTFNFTTVDAKELENNLVFYNKCIAWQTFKDNLKDYNVIINTIPTEIFKNSDEQKFNKGSYLFEIASVKCLENIYPKEFNYILCPRLPSKHTYKSAANLMEEVIRKNINF